MSVATTATLAGTFISAGVGISTLGYNIIRIRKTLETHLASQDEHLAAQDAKLHALKSIVSPDTPREDEAK